MLPEWFGSSWILHVFFDQPNGWIESLGNYSLIQLSNDQYIKQHIIYMIT